MEEGEEAREEEGGRGRGREKGQRKGGKQSCWSYDHYPGARAGFGLGRVGASVYVTNSPPKSVYPAP